MGKHVFIGVLFAAVAVIFFFLGQKTHSPTGGESGISPRTVGSAEQLIGIEFAAEERDSMIDDLTDYVESYQLIRKVAIENAVPPAFRFDPVPAGHLMGSTSNRVALGPLDHVDVPGNIEELAFWSVRDLAELMRTRRITSTQLTEMYLDRLEKHGSTLECVVTLTKELALAQAARADREIARGKYRGPLHGIPYGAKDLLAVKGYKTTWGAAPYQEQVIDEDATVIKKLEEAGAVLVAKLTLGALAWGDVWFGGKTRNPWNLEQGSSGSSAGSASATAAGLVAFAIGTETWGSIVSPSTRCGTTGLRPTYGRVSRAGAMALSWTMDKIGPICRTVEDCAIVFDAIMGPDDTDPTVIDVGFDYDSDLQTQGLRIGFTKELFESDYVSKTTDAATLDKLREMGIDLVPIELPDYPIASLSFVLSAEAAAAFDELTRSNRDDLLVRQIKNAWPNVFRSSRFIPAVEYIQANRIRTMLNQAMVQVFDDAGVDIYVAPSFGGDNLLLTNLTGHPCVVLPNGFNEEGSPVSISFIGRLYEEGKLLALANAYQVSTDHHRKHPAGFGAEARGE
ncbi:MAG: amidase [Candidatus Latescibacterota bacterium]|nr:MAG: amidase [Candidatus Latescibacterota bacterium]